MILCDDVISKCLVVKYQEGSDTICIILVKSVETVDSYVCNIINKFTFWEAFWRSYFMFFIFIINKFILKCLEWGACLQCVVYPKHPQRRTEMDVIMNFQSPFLSTQLPVSVLIFIHEEFTAVLWVRSTKLLDKWCIGTFPNTKTTVKLSPVNNLFP